MTAPLQPEVLDQAFRLAAGELGMCDAAWRFADEVEAEGGPGLLEAVRDVLGTSFPVLDAVFLRRLESQRPTVETRAVLAACEGLKRLVVVGLEARWLDALIGALPEVELAVLPSAALVADAARVAANLPSRVELIGLDRFQRLAGPRSGLLTFVYGVASSSAFVLPEWVRCQGADVRAQFRSFIGWNLLGSPPEVYPRWLVETSSDVFTHLVLA